MQVYLDDQQLNTTGTTLNEVLLEAVDTLKQAGRMIVEVRYDGRSLVGRELDQERDAVITAEEVQLITAQPAELAVQALREVQEALIAAEDDRKQAAELLQSDDPTAAMEHIRELTIIWQQAQVSVLQTTQLMEIPIDQIEVDGLKAPEMIDGLLEQLREMKEQLLANDWIGLSDSLAYEMEATGARWRSMIDAICDAIER